jgi:hypothetical protein
MDSIRMQRARAAVWSAAAALMVMACGDAGTGENTSPATSGGAGGATAPGGAGGAGAGNAGAGGAMPNAGGSSSQAGSGSAGNMPNAGAGGMAMPRAGSGGAGAGASGNGGASGGAGGASGGGSGGRSGSGGMGGGASGGGGTGGNGGDGASFGEVYAIVAAKCGGPSGCHVMGASGGLAMPNAATAYDNLVDVASEECSGETRVVPGDADGSLLIQAIEGEACVEQMPRGRAPLSAAEIATFREWIESGAAE